MRSFDQYARPRDLARAEEIEYGLFMRYILYRFYDANRQLLYVGITNYPRERWRLHRRKSSWWSSVAFVSVHHLPDEKAARAAERKAIQTENPMHNVRERPGWYPAAAAHKRARKPRTGQTPRDS
jgi:excinuclease UvrABC nuclease subunit